MRTLNRIIWAVVAIAAITSCTTDTTEDLAVKGGGKTTLTLSLDGSRTQLGDKANEAYPLTWAEGDQVSVNGNASDALTAEEAGEATATFTFEGELATPYYLAYPAAAAGQVEFPATQFKPETGNISNNATVLYGYGANGAGIKLNHLTGLLKIGVKSSTKLISIQLSTLDRKPIAGAFNLDFATGELTPTETADEVITYYFSPYYDAVEFSDEEATYVYIAVPAGTYDELYVTITDEMYGVMHTTIKADSTKPLKAGNVREFNTDLVYEATSTADKFVINTYGSLLQFKKAVEDAQAVVDNTESTADELEAANATLAMPAEFHSDITIPISSFEGAWSSINAKSYVGTIEGNGFAVVYDKYFTEDNILTEPLFNEVASTIHGLHVRGLYINNATSTVVGGMINTYHGANISHCSVAGKINISCSSDKVNYIGGLVGLTDYIDGDMSLTDCVNNCDITVNLSNEGEEYLRLGGLFGYVKKATLGAGETQNTSATLHTLTMSNLTNNKPVKVIGGGSAGNMYIGGIAASVGGLYVATLTNLHNKADMTVEVDAANPIRLAGIIAEKYNSSGNRYYHFTAEDCTNSGNIKATVKTTSTGTSNTTIAGLFGQLYDEEEGKSTLTNCDNSGNIEFYGAPTQTELTVRVDLGGVIGVASGRVNISNCDNTGEKIYTDIGTQAGILTMGGIAGRTSALSTNNVSSASNLVTLNTCTNKANISYYVQTTKKEMFIGGILGSWYGSGSTRFRLTMYSCTNEGNLLASSNVVSGTTTRTLMGLIGSSWMNGNSIKTNNKSIHKFEIKDCVNGKADGSSTMTITGDSHRHINVGGIMGYCYAHYTIDNCTNNMKYIYDSKSTDVHYYGGLYGRYYQNKHLETTASNNDTNGTVKLWSNIKSFTNNGAADIKVSSENTLCASGIFSITDGANDIYITLGNVTNNGTLTISNKVADATCENLYVGGIIADMKNRETSLYDTSAAVITNNGNISVTGVKGSTNNVIGAAIGDLQKDFSNITVDCTLAVDEGVAAGMLTGVASTTAYAFTDCKVGGTFIEGATETTLDSTNLAKYLFSDRVLTSYAGVTLME